MNNSLTPGFCGFLPIRRVHQVDCFYVQQCEKDKFLLRALLTDAELHRVYLTAMDDLRSSIWQLGLSYQAEVMGDPTEADIVWEAGRRLREWEIVRSWWRQEGDDPEEFIFLRRAEPAVGRGRGRYLFIFPFIVFSLTFFFLF